MPPFGYTTFITESNDILTCRQTLMGLGLEETQAAENIYPAVYSELRRIAGARMRREPGERVLQPTALVNEAYLKVVDQKDAKINSKTHFIAIASVAMQRILCDHARARNAKKRGGDLNREPLDDVAAKGGDQALVEAVAVAVEKLGAFDARKAAVVRLRFLGGLTTEQIAETLGVARSTVDADWAAARDWIKEELAS